MLIPISTKNCKIEKKMAIINYLLENEIVLFWHTWIFKSYSLPVYMIKAYFSPNRIVIFLISIFRGTVVTGRVTRGTLKQGEKIEIIGYGKYHMCKANGMHAI